MSVSLKPHRVLSALFSLHYAGLMTAILIHFDAKNGDFL